jgi:membrane protein
VLRLPLFAIRVAGGAFMKFLHDDGWAIASHIALSTLMSLFPFLIFLTALTSLLFGSEELAQKAAQILLDAWPEEVAKPIASEISNVLTRAHGGVVTFGAVLALYFSANGVESLRIGLNRAYDETETRPWWLLRVESLAYVVVGAVALSALSFLIVLAPLIQPTVLHYAPGLAGIESVVTVLRYGITGLILALALVVAHKWLAGGQRNAREIAPGIVVTLLLWMLSAFAFARYLAEFSGAYVRTYAGLASAMIALVFLYWTAGIFVYGGELNQAISRERQRGGGAP